MGDAKQKLAQLVQKQQAAVEQYNRLRDQLDSLARVITERQGAITVLNELLQKEDDDDQVGGA